MKTRYIILLYAILLFAGCASKQQGEQIVIAPPRPSPMVINHPAAIVFNSDISGNTSAVSKSSGSIEEILTPFDIPVISSKKEEIEFVKSNGDRVKLDISKLKANYDVILFNAVNDPLPCYIKDLRKAALNCFTKKSLLTEQNIRGTDNNQATQVEQTWNTVPDTLRLSHIEIGSKKICLLIPDSSAIPLSIRNIPGIEWIETRLDSRTFLDISFENDLITYANTDRYFTNGITISLQSPWFSRSKASLLMIPYRHPSHLSYSMVLVQNMYTPKDTRIAPTFKNDRPYASYLYLGLKKITTDPGRGVRLTNQVDMGYLGPYSPGAYFQSLVHESFPTNDKPLGWETQIRTDIILNYSLNIEKALVQEDKFMLSASASAKAGTLYNKGGIGFRLQAGRQEPYFGIRSGIALSPWQYYFFLETNTDFVAYDATLQGGPFNRENIFSLKSNEISHLTASAEGGLRITYKGTGLELAQHYLSPEYKTGLWHKWGRISLIFKL